jgi:hypothetical protein
MKVKSHKQHFRMVRRPVARNLASRLAWVMLCRLCVDRNTGGGGRYVPPERGVHLPDNSASHLLVGCDDDPAAYGGRRIIWNVGTFLPDCSIWRFGTGAFTLTAVNVRTSNLTHVRANGFSVTCSCWEHGLKSMLMIRYNGFGGGPMVIDSFRTKQFVLPRTCPLNCDRFPPANVGLSEVCSTACY